MMRCFIGSKSGKKLFLSLLFLIFLLGLSPFPPKLAMLDKIRKKEVSPSVSDLPAVASAREKPKLS